MSLLMRGRTYKEPLVPCDMDGWVISKGDIVEYYKNYSASLPDYEQSPDKIYRIIGVNYKTGHVMGIQIGHGAPNSDFKELDTISDNLRVMMGNTHWALGDWNK